MYVVCSIAAIPVGPRVVLEEAVTLQMIIMSFFSDF